MVGSVAFHIISTYIHNCLSYNFNSYKFYSYNFSTYVNLKIFQLLFVFDLFFEYYRLSCINIKYQINYIRIQFNIHKIRLDYQLYWNNKVPKKGFELSKFFQMVQLNRPWLDRTVVLARIFLAQFLHKLFTIDFFEKYMHNTHKYPCRH